MDHILPEYLSEETRQAIKATAWTDMLMTFIPYRNRERAKREQRYPVILIDWDLGHVQNK
jgi:hypothetical protein